MRTHLSEIIVRQRGTSLIASCLLGVVTFMSPQASAQQPSVQFLQQGRGVSASSSAFGGSSVRDSADFPGLGTWSDSATAELPGIGRSSAFQSSTLEVIPPSAGVGAGIRVAVTLNSSAARFSQNADGGAIGSFGVVFAVSNGPAEYVLDAPFTITSGVGGTGPSASMYGPEGFIEVFDWFRSPLGGFWPTGQVRGTLVPGIYNLSGGLAAFASLTTPGEAQLNWTMSVTPFRQTPACRADVNNSGSITVQDIFDFLGFYFANDTRADVNFSGSITVQDIFDFLASYFAGC